MKPSKHIVVDNSKSADTLGLESIWVHLKKNPVLFGTVAYLFLIIFRPFEFWEWLGAYRIERVYMLCLIGIIFIWPKKRYISHPITKTVLAFFGVICFSILIAYQPEIAKEQSWRYFKLLVLYFVILLTVNNSKDFKVLIISFVAINGLYIGMSLREFLFGGRYQYRMGIKRLVGIDKTYYDPNSFAATIILTLPYAWAIFRSKITPLLKTILLIYGAISMIAIVLTGSRGGMLGIIVFALIVLAKSKKKIVGFAILSIALLFGFMALPDEIQIRLFTIFDSSISESANVSAQGRIEGLKNGFKLFMKSPIWGFGAGNFPYAKSVLGVEGNLQAHSLYGQLLGELGILGITSFSILCFLFYKASRQIHKKFKQLNYTVKNQSIGFYFLIGEACETSLMLLLYQGLLGHNLYRYNWILFCAFLVLAHHFAIKKRSENSHENK